MAQPLYVTNITVPSPYQGTCSPCNMVIAVTLNGTVFAWNADGAQAGNLLWSRQKAGGNTSGGNALWYDDCGPFGSGPLKQGDTIQFEGILSTPVIDVNAATPMMFLTSACVDSSGKGEWWLHGIDLTTGNDASVGGTSQHRRLAGPSSDFTSITAGWQQQRPALLLVKNGSTNLLYILFGTNVGENVYPLDYTGWNVMYETNSSTGLQPVQAYSNEPTNCGTGGGQTLGGSPNGQCTAGNSGAPSCDCYLGSADSPPNWGGHGGGCWMSGNGPAASPRGTVDNDTAVHVFFGCGNGGFQEFNGSTPSSSNNYGQAIVDFPLTAAGASTQPFQAFTPKSPAGGLAPSAPQACGCDSNGNNCTTCPYTFQALNSYDYDMSTSGVALFKDLSGSPRLVTVDKAGYGYLMTQGNLCGSGTNDTACVGFAAGDPGSWTFGASARFCTGSPDDCDRVTGFSFSDNQVNSNRSVYMHYWPYSERLTALKLSDNSTANSGTGQLTSDAGVSAYTMKLSASCTPDVNCLSDQVVAGDTLSLSGCSCMAGTQCPPVITSVTTNTAADSELTLNLTVAAAFGTSCAFPRNFQYTGYFVTPAHDSTPSVPSGGYPGAALNGSANCTSGTCTNSMVWAILPDSSSYPDGLQRGLGTLYGYTALPNSSDILTKDWNSTDTWCASSFARPTITNATIFVPTYAVSYGTNTFSSCPTSNSSSVGYPSGILVYR